MRALVLALLLLSASPALAETGPLPPCGNAPEPAYPQPGEPPRARYWQRGELSPDWTPPACAGWRTAGYRFLLALAGRFESNEDADVLLGRFGAVSAMLRIRYWSVTDQAWKDLLQQAFALDGPDLEHRRADFTAAELRSGRDLYFAQQDSRSSGAVVYRMRLRAARAERLVIEIENATPVRYYALQLFGPGDLQAVYFLDRRAPGGWDYYSLTRTGAGSSSLADGNEKSYVNRAVAFYRHLAGMPTDRDPPAAR